MIKDNLVLKIFTNLTKITQLKSHRIIIWVVFYVIHNLNACHVKCGPWTSFIFYSF